jgi:ABC-type Fe3+-hydroxamate transport system substrate-binding protein
MGCGLLDATGALHEVAGPGARIVSLVPSITELLCDLGLAGQLVGRSGFCIHPRETVRAIPKVGGTKDVRADRVRALAPTHVVVNIDENRRETAEELATFVPSVIVTHPLDPLDNLALFRLLGGIFGKVEEAERLCAAFESEYRSLVSKPHEPADVLYLIWRDPWMTVSRDTYISRTLALVGWQTLPAGAGDRYPVIDLASYAGRVERVLLSSEPYRFREKHLAEVVALVPRARVALIDGEMTSWYGSRAIRGLRYLGMYTAPA